MAQDVCVSSCATMIFYSYYFSVRNVCSIIFAYRMEPTLEGLKTVSPDIWDVNMKKRIDFISMHDGGDLGLY